MYSGYHGIQKFQELFEILDLSSVSCLPSVVMPLNQPARAVYTALPCNLALNRLAIMTKAPKLDLEREKMCIK